jgi:hypothetical protein
VPMSMKGYRSYAFAWRTIPPLTEFNPSDPWLLCSLVRTVWRRVCSAAPENLFAPRERFESGIPIGSIIALWMAVACFAPNEMALATTGPSLKIVARSGPAGISDIRNQVSINDDGLVAFVAATPEGLAAFVGDGINAPRKVVDGARGNMSSCVQINNAGRIIVMRGPLTLTTDPVIAYVPIIGPIEVSPGYTDSIGFLQLWTVSDSPLQTLVAESDSRLTESFVFGIGPLAVGPFSALGPAFSVNNVGQAVFVANEGVGFNDFYVLATQDTQGRFNDFPINLAAQPMIADDGSIVCRNGASQASPIVRLNYDLTKIETIAGRDQGFTTLGLSPGISDNGDYIAFYGELTSGAASAPGIFLSRRSGAIWQTRNLAGLKDRNGKLLFEGFDGTSRVGVNTLKGSEDVLVVFGATDGTGRRGVYSCRYSPLRNSVSDPEAIIIEGNGSPSVSGPFVLFDPVNTAGQVAAWANGQVVLSAEQSPTRASISGRLLDSCRNLPIAGAWVRVLENSTQTGPDGRFVFDDVSYHGTAVITFEASGFQTASLPVEVTQGTLSVGDIPLERKRASVQVLGRVLNQKSRGPMPSVLVILAGKSDTTVADGTFVLNDVPTCGNLTIQAANAGYATYSTELSVPLDASTITLPDILLQNNSVNPVVTGVKPKYDGLFLSGLRFVNEYVASVDWGGASPGRVEFTANGILAATVGASASGAIAQMDMGTGFSGTFGFGRNYLQIVAMSADGRRSEPFLQPVNIIPMPTFLEGLVPFGLISGGKPGFEFKLDIPADGIDASSRIPLPILKKLEVDLSLEVGFKYEITDGAWKFHGGGDLKSPKFAAGDGKFDVSISLTGDGHASQTQGISVDDVGVVLGLNGKYPLLTVYVLDLVPGAEVLHLLDGLIIFGVDINSIQRFKLNWILDLEEEFDVQLRRRAFKLSDLTVEPGLEALYAPNLSGCELEMKLSGTLEFDVPLKLPISIHSVDAKASFGLKTVVWGKITNEWEFVVFHGQIYPPLTGSTSSAVGSAVPKAAKSGLWFSMPVKRRPPGSIDRKYLGLGLDGLAETAKAGSATTSLMESSSSSTFLEQFRSMGKTKDKRGFPRASEQVPPKSQELLTPSPTQADLPLVTNVFPYAHPSLASHGNELMLLYAGDTGSSNSSAFTNIRFTRFDGTNWSEPAWLHQAAAAEFNPVVAFTDQGDAIAVWERADLPPGTGGDISSMAAHMEIAWSIWGRRTGSWTPPATLTTNAFLDHAPLLCGPMLNGDLLLVWTRNAANQLAGTGSDGARENDQVISSRWISGEARWESSGVLASNITRRFSQSLAGRGDVAIHAWTQDIDQNPTNGVGQQVFYQSWTNGAWGPLIQLTSDLADDTTVRAAISANGRAYLAWRNDSNLVLSLDLSGTNLETRPITDSTAFADYGILAAPEGRVALYWEESSQEGQDPRLSVFDPASRSWGMDQSWLRDSSLERSFSPTLDDQGNLVLAYEKVTLIHTNETYELEGGGLVTFTNQLEFGQTDLHVTKKALGVDLAIAPGGFSAQGDMSLPGSPVSFLVHIANLGALPATNVALTIYDGDPAVNGTPIVDLTLPDGLKGGDSGDLQGSWPVPEPVGAHEFFAVANPKHVFPELDWSNNSQSLRVGGVDLAVDVISKTAVPNGAVRVIARLRNLGAVSAPPSVLVLRSTDGTNPSLARLDIPELLPREEVQLPLDAGPGTQPPGEARYILAADDTASTGDVNTNNNFAVFSIILWIDSDGDGMPDDWEISQGFNPNDPADATDDADGDKMSNFAEYIAGTDPHVSFSYLRISSISLKNSESGGFQLRWGSEPFQVYEIERSTNSTSGFAVLAGQLLSTPPENIYLDTSATNSTTYFYRLRME